jgi:hypothetical protein
MRKLAFASPMFIGHLASNDALHSALEIVTSKHEIPLFVLPMNTDPEPETETDSYLESTLDMELSAAIREMADKDIIIISEPPPYLIVAAYGASGKTDITANILLQEFSVAKGYGYDETEQKINSTPHKRFDLRHEWKFRKVNSTKLFRRKVYHRRQAR